MPEPTPAADDVSEASHDTADHLDGGDDADPDTPECELVALVDETPDGREYTIGPANASAADLVTTWLTVDEAAVYDRDDWR
jgi:hypothetical protein